jgi:glycosyltransferase involved in cell wall biosynthesis
MRGPVFFDCRYIRVDHHDGISRFSASLFAALSELIPLTAIINDDRQLAHLPTETKWVKLNDPTHWTEFLAARRLNRHKPAVVYSPMQTIGSYGRKFKLVLTLHDLIYYRHPAPPPSMPLAVRIGWRLFHLTYWPQRWLLNAADAVVTVSQTTANLMTKHRLTSKPITVVYNASGDLHEDYEHRQPEQRPSPNEPQRLVYMGSFMDYKNVATLVRGLAELSGYQLHLLSKIRPERRTQLEAIAANAGVNPDSLVFHNGVSETKYHELLDSAVALVHASHDEGFGIPVVEAMSRGIPVVLSDIPIFHEIAGQVGEFFPATNASAFAAAVRGLENPAIWLGKSEAGILQAQQFSWEASAVALLGLLETL